MDPPDSPPLWVDILGTDGPQWFTDEDRIVGDDLLAYHDQLSQLHQQIHPIVEQQLRGRIPEAEIEQVAHQFMLIVDFVSLYGEYYNSFPHRLYRVYQTGGFPCAWKGWFPEGQLVVYRPRG